LNKTPTQLELRGGFLFVGDGRVLPLTGPTCEYGTSGAAFKRALPRPLQIQTPASPTTKTRRRKSGDALHVGSIRFN
jgi:hypothetical protein